MLDRVGQVVAWSKTHQGKKLIRFTSVSVISTVVSLSLIAIFYGIARWGVIEATVSANVLATIPAYNLNRRWTWGKTGRSHVVKEVMPFWIMSSLGIAASFFGSLLARHIVRTNHFPHEVNTLIVLGMNFISFAIFWVLKLLVFNRIFHVPSELEEVEEHLEHEEEVEHDAELAHDGEGLSP
jgi:putative flippase GtrA